VRREVLATRNGVSIFDSSTLGKIDLKGRDCVTLLNRVYTNAWNALDIGRVRYGLMLGEDGMVLDDGVTARLGDHHYLMTTTSGGAARVYNWIEDWLQCEWPDLDVVMTSVTTHWASATLAGPKARAVLQRAECDFDIGPEDFPHMALREGSVAGIPARVLRVSFSGELSYEINVPASLVMALWQALLDAGRPENIAPAGLEAFSIMRAEKGYIHVGQETDGAVVPADLGMDWIVSKKKADFIGKRSLARSFIAGAERRHLVGLLSEDPQQVIPDGAYAVAQVTDQPPMPLLGHVTSSYFSPTLERSIALALITRGRERIGDTLEIPLADKVIRARVTEPRFYDPEGERLRG